MTRAATKSRYHCTECGWNTVKWLGRCGECQAWGSIAQLDDVTPRTTVASTVNAPAPAIATVDASHAEYLETGVAEFDRVLGGGVVPGSVILLAGEPGVGKSTLLLDAAARFSRTHGKALYLTGEESAAQVKLRADRIDALAPALHLAAENDLGTSLGQIEQLLPALLIVDSVQALSSAAVEGSTGGVTQVREVTASLIAAAKKHNMVTVLIGHVTKDGSIAGPRSLEHLVDVVCQFEGERDSRLRLLRAVKNRYGPTDEIGCFDLGEDGIEGLADPSGLFLSQTTDSVPGNCVTVTLEGRRPLVSEVQSLLVTSSTAQPRRATSGVDSSRLAMLLAVLQQRAGLRLAQDDCYVSTVGGVRLGEPASDLAIALSLSSAKAGLIIPRNLVACGEVGLAGEVRPVPGISSRIQEAYRLGFTQAIVPVGGDTPEPPPNFHVHRVRNLSQALEALEQQQLSRLG